MALKYCQPSHGLITCQITYGNTLWYVYLTSQQFETSNHQTRKQDTTLKLTFTDKSSGNEIGCVNAKLSNGVSLQNIVVPWATGLVTIFLVLAAVVLGAVGMSKSGTTASPTGGLVGDPQSTSQALSSTTGAVIGQPGPPAGHTDPLTLFLHFQFISTTGLLSISYPLFYRSFTINFAWANFILPIKSLHKAASPLRDCDIDKNTTLPIVSPGLSKGIAAYSAQMGISEQDIFMLIYFVFLCACLILLGVHLIAKGVVHGLVVRATGENKAVWERRSRWVTHMVSNNSLRLVRDYHQLNTLITFSLTP